MTVTSGSISKVSYRLSRDAPEQLFLDNWRERLEGIALSVLLQLLKSVTADLLRLGMRRQHLPIARTVDFMPLAAAKLKEVSLRSLGLSQCNKAPEGERTEHGRLEVHHNHASEDLKQTGNHHEGGHHRGNGERPMFATITIAVLHCGAGCVLGDIVGEWLVYGTGAAIKGWTLGAEYLKGECLLSLMFSGPITDYS